MRGERDECRAIADRKSTENARLMAQLNEAKAELHFAGTKSDTRVHELQ